MKWVSRSALGWPPSAAPSQASARGVKVHYEGTSVDCDNHDECVSLVKAVRKSHLANKVENYSDIAYNLLVCRHGYVFEGRGRGKRTGANGNQALNQAHYAVMALLGSKGDTEPTPEMVSGIKEAIAYLREHGAGKEIKGHRDGFPTACPGGPLYALVQSGALEPGKASAPKPIPKPSAKPKPSYAPFPGNSFFKKGKKHPLVTSLGKALVKAGWKGYKVGPGPTFSETDRKAVEWFQKKQGWSGKDADGYPGPETWKRLKVPRP